MLLDALDLWCSSSAFYCNVALLRITPMLRCPGASLTGFRAGFKAGVSLLASAANPRQSLVCMRPRNALKQNACLGMIVSKGLVPAHHHLGFLLYYNVCDSMTDYGFSSQQAQDMLYQQALSNSSKKTSCLSSYQLCLSCIANTVHDMALQRAWCASGCRMPTNSAQHSLHARGRSLPRMRSAR